MRRRLAQEQGMAMVLAVFAGALLALLSLTLIGLVEQETQRSTQQVTRGAAFQAAEAGIEDYVAKLVDDRQYYLHQVHRGESTRRASGGQTATAGTAWAYGTTWTYPGGADTWVPLSNGYEYNLQVTAPSAAAATVRIFATGRRTGSAQDQRSVEVLIRPSSLADFYRVVDGNVGWGSGATTNGKIYANGNIDHDGTAAASLYAEGSITGSVTLTNGAKKYDSSTIRTQIKNPINFANFVSSLVDIQRAAQLSGIYLDNAAYHGWRLAFNADGTVSVQGCTRNSGRDVADLAPVCGTATAYNVPANGAIYAAQTPIVSGQVNGRVTVASNDQIVVAGNISFVTSGDDVLGLVCKNDLVIARHAPTTLSWAAGVLSQSGTWRTYSNSSSHTTMSFSGSSATADGGSMTMYATRNYSYDPAFQYLPPPWFPMIEDAYTIALFRELPPS